MAVTSNRVAFPLVLQSPVTGSAIVGASATITKHEVGKSPGSGPEAEIFTTETEATKVAGNTITSDNTGRWTRGEGAGYAQYWLPEGTYDISISGTGLTTVVITRELVSGNTVTSLVTGLNALEKNAVRAEPGEGTTPLFVSWGRCGGGTTAEGSEDFTFSRPSTGEFTVKWKKAKSGKWAIVLSSSAGSKIGVNGETNAEFTVITSEPNSSNRINASWMFVVIGNG